MKNIKCKFCGNEFDNSILPICPKCFKSPIAKERISKFIWQTVFYLISLTCAVLLCFGIYYKFKNDAFLALPFFILYIYSIIKMKEFTRPSIASIKEKLNLTRKSEADLVKSVADKPTDFIPLPEPCSNLAGM